MSVVIDNLSIELVQCSIASDDCSSSTEADSETGSVTNNVKQSQSPVPHTDASESMRHEHEAQLSNPSNIVIQQLPLPLSSPDSFNGTSVSISVKDPQIQKVATSSMNSAPLWQKLFNRTIAIHPIHQEGVQTVGKRTLLHVVLRDRITDEQFFRFQTWLQQPLTQLVLVIAYFLGMGLILAFVFGASIPQWTAIFALILPLIGMIARFSMLNVDLAILVMREFECWFLMANNFFQVLAIGELFHWDMRALTLPAQFLGTTSVIFGDAILLSRPRMLSSLVLALLTLWIVWICLVTGNTTFDYSYQITIASYRINLVDFMANRMMTMAGFFSKSLYVALKWPDSPVTFRPMFHFQTRSSDSTSTTTSVNL